MNGTLGAILKEWSRDIVILSLSAPAPSFSWM
jgi:hypothetical protein